LALGGCAMQQQDVRADGKRPNIVFLLTDDQRWDTLGCMGNPIIQTPHIDSMAEKGVLFRNAFVTTSICCTSRASFFSGQHAIRHDIHNFGTRFTPEALAQTYPAQLRAAGYRTGFIGKYGVGTPQPEDFDYNVGFGGQGKYEHEDENGNYRHLTQIMGDQAIEFLGDCSQDQPFCLSISFKAPHVQDGDPRQFIYDRALADLYKDDEIPVPKTADPKYWESFPEFFRADNEARARWDIRFSTPEKYQESVKGYYRLITGIDNAVGRIREDLERRGLADNTVIVLMGDNGFYLGEHGMAGKWYGHEESIRVPLVVYDPRLPKRLQGRERQEQALNIDLAPTFLAMAGVAIPEGMQGADLTPLVHGESPDGWRTDFFYEHRLPYNRIPQSEGVVGERFKYLRYIEQDPVFEELYDLAEDPHEEQNLADDASHAETLEQMRRRCDALAASCR
jgi:arylsulfatase A-like enzyme